MTHTLRLATAALLMTATSAVAGAPLYRVSAQLTYAEGPTFGPEMLVEAEHSASMRVDGDSGYAWEIRLSEVDPAIAEATVHTRLQIADQHFEPSIRVRLDQPAHIELGELQLELLVQAEGED